MKRLGFSILLAFAAASPAQALWREARTTHFVIYSEASEGALQRYAQQLEKFDKALRFVQGRPDFDPGPANRLTVYVLDGQRAVARLAGRGGGDVAGFYQARTGGSVAFTPRNAGTGEFDLSALTVLLHEYTHHFMYTNFSASYPRWVSEGYAEFFSSAIFPTDGTIGVGTPAKHRAATFYFGYDIALEQLFAPPQKGLSPDREAAFYAWSWLLVHYLWFEDTRKGQFADYLRQVFAGTPSLDAARSAFGDLKQLQRDLSRYRGRSKLTYLHLPADVTQTKPASIRVMGPGEQALMDIRIRSRRGVTEKTAAEIVVDARALAAPFPNDPFVQATLAEAEYDAGNLDAAERAADATIAADPKSMDGRLYKVMVLFHRAAGTPAGSPEWKAARAAVIAANRLDPEDPRPLVDFYRLYEEQGIAPTKNAVAGLIRALEHAPQSTDLRMRVVRQHLFDGRAKEARAALLPIVFHPHDGAWTARARDAMTLIDEGKPGDALARLDQPDPEEAPAAAPE
jgi:tetratricopeptide (TPR) repeat protein